MSDFPPQISRFLSSHHVLGLCVQGDDGPWAASCFYALDSAAQRLIILSDRNTLHGQMMQRSPMVAGTISAQPQHVREIRGIQFTARAEWLENPDDIQAALDIYLQRHSLARLFKSDVWSLWLETIKFTSNKYVFGQKIHWRASRAD